MQRETGWGGHKRPMWNRKSPEWAVLLEEVGALEGARQPESAGTREGARVRVPDHLQ